MDYQAEEEMMNEQMQEAAMMDIKDEPAPTLLPAQYNPPTEEKAVATTDPKANRAMEVAAALDQAYPGASKVPLQPEERVDLMRRFSDDDVSILPHEGLIYIPHIVISDRLNAAIGAGEWAMVRRREWLDNDRVYAEWILLIRGAFVGETVSSHPYVQKNPLMDYADALESTRGIALRRIAGKDLSCGSQVWHPSYAEQWKAKFAYIKEWKTDKYGKKKPVWARKPVNGPRSPSDASEPAPAVSAQPAPKDAPQAKRSAKSGQSGESDEQRLERWKAQLRPLEPYASFWLIDNGKLLPNEGVEDLHFTNLPATVKEAKEIVASIKERMEIDGATPPADPVPADSSPQSEPAEDSIMLKVIGQLPVPWKEVPVPFGKAKGQKFGDLEKGQLWWWCVQWEPKPWAGKDGQLRDPSEFDQALRLMLDQVQEKYGFKAKGE